MAHVIDKRIATGMGRIREHHDARVVVVVVVVVVVFDCSLDIVTGC